jgi:hypothetical protein
VRQFTIVRPDFPGGIKKQIENGRWRLRKPRFQILLETFLSFQIFRDDNDGFLRKQFLQQRGEKRLRRRGNSRKSQRSASVQSPREGLRGGSFQNVSEQIACR